MSEDFLSLGLQPILVEALKKENITQPTDIQGRVIPEALKNNDLIATAPTGTGKTLAYILPLFEKVKPGLKEMQAIVLVPTHELAIQIQRQIERLSENSGIKPSSTVIIGNVNIDRQIEKLKEKPNFIVGSPGRILELIKKKKIMAHTVKSIVIDEADRLMDDNNRESVKAIIKSTLKERQLMMFSASITAFTENYGKEIMKDPVIVQGGASLAVPQGIEHIFMLVDDQRGKLELLRKLGKNLNPSRAIIFVNKSDEIELITEKLKFHGLNADSLHGTNIKLDRKKTMEAFRSGRLQFLIASDLAARGLDFEGLTHIFNLDLPEEPAAYLHRAGRTGRKGNSGLAISIVTQRELGRLKEYGRVLNIKFIEKSMYEGRLIDGKRPAGRPQKAENKRRQDTFLR